VLHSGHGERPPQNLLVFLCSDSLSRHMHRVIKSGSKDRTATKASYPFFLDKFPVWVSHAINYNVYV